MGTLASMLTVKPIVAEPFAGMTGALGAIAHAIPSGWPEQLRDTGPEKALREVTVHVAVAQPRGVTSGDGWHAISNEGDGGDGAGGGVGAVVFWPPLHATTARSADTASHALQTSR